MFVRVFLERFIVALSVRQIHKQATFFWPCYFPGQTYITKYQKKDDRNSPHSSVQSSSSKLTQELRSLRLAVSSKLLPPSRLHHGRKRTPVSLRLHSQPL